MSTDEIRKRASKLHATISARNTREYIVGSALVVFFAAFALIAKSDLGRLALLLSAGGVAVSMWQLHRLARAAAGDEIYLVTQWSEFYRTQLARQRDALRRVWIWYLGPLVPGMVLFWIASGLKDINAGNTVQGLAVTMVGLLITFGVFLAVGSANRKAADRLQAEIALIDRLIAEK